MPARAGNLDVYRRAGEFGADEHAHLREAQAVVSSAACVERMPPGVRVAVAAALRIHPLAVGIAVGFAGQAALAQVNLGRAGRIDRAALRSTQ